MTQSAPVATYRLQLRNGLDLAGAQRILPYLRRLGVSHLYLSPVFEARAGSTHGYDVTDPNRVDPVLGGEDAFRTFARDAKSRGFAIILDIVPNHMAASLDNAWWTDVLARGRRSPYASYFDIDWNAHGNKVFLPYLDRPLEEAIQQGAVGFDTVPTPHVRVGDIRLPVAASSVGDPAPNDNEAASVLIEKPRLRQVLSQQHYVLGAWQEVAVRGNYRRFFDISDLVCLRIEDPAVFDAVHARLFEFCNEGLIDGVRIDHVDGLADPKAYLDRLRRTLPGGMRLALVEKILAPHETLPAGWSVDGTTGYEFADHASRFLVSSRGLESLARVYEKHTAQGGEYGTVLYHQRQTVVDTLFRGTFERLAEDLRDLLAKLGVPSSPEKAYETLRNVTCSLRVYRTYIDDGSPSAEDLAEIDRACSQVATTAETAMFASIRSVLRLEVPADVESSARRWVRRWQQFTGALMAKGHEDTGLYLYHRLVALNDVGGRPDAPALGPEALHVFNARRGARWPRTLNATSTHDTKRSEDVRARLLVLSEIPEEWDAFVSDLRDLHAPLIGTIHGKRAPTPNLQYLLYQTLVGSWPLDASLWVNYGERLRAYIVKAAREGKRRTNWLEPDSDYEVALTEFVNHLLADHKTRARIDAFVARVALPGAVNSLAMLTLKLGSPGIPDIYRGCESWDLSLVDPDNRRPVSFDAFSARLADVDEGPGTLASFLHSWRDGRVKLYATTTGLRCRAEHPAAFEGSYEPVAVEGERADQVLAFRRVGEKDEVLIVVPRFTTGATLDGAWPTASYWGGTRLVVERGARFRNVFDGSDATAHDGSLLLRELLFSFPCALAERV